MIPRAQLPVHSPLPSRALFAGFAGALGGHAQLAAAEQIRAHFNAGDVLLTGSGTSALGLGVMAGLRRSGGIVALPAYACYDLATAADFADARVVLYDLDPHTLAPDAASLARALAHDPDVLVLVHLYGIASDVGPIVDAARDRGILVIEDAAQAFGATIGGAAAGSVASVAVLSFGRGKGVTAGSGGALLANDGTGAEIVRKARMLIGSGRAGWSELVRSTAQFLLARPQWYELPSSLPFLQLGATTYHRPSAAREISNASSKMLRAVWSQSLRAVEVRRTNARRLLAAAANSPHWQPVTVNSTVVPSYLRLPLIARSAQPLPLDQRARRLGIARGYPRPLFELDGFRDRLIDQNDSFPGAAHLARGLITLPTHGMLDASDIAALEEWVVEA